MTADALEVAPDPAALIESMRAFGYALPTALADLIDNSISAGARQVEVEFRWAGRESSIAVIDDGCGMDAAGVVEAMRLGSRSAVEERTAQDLGRFGLGLKSAAWSQGRSLTVISRPAAGPTTAKRWDLDHVTETKRWLLLEDISDTGQELQGRITATGYGTAVIVEQLDRLVGGAALDDAKARRRFLEAVNRTAHHLGMVFHRFLVGRNALTLSINGEPVEPWDPFLEHHAATQVLPSETFSIDTSRIEVAPFVLPHFSKLSKEEHEQAAGLRGWNAQQGFYVYRGRRLLVAGGWLGLKRMQQEEHYKLARIRVDLPNSSDQQWQIDVRKASARIPSPLIDGFERVARATRSKASDAYRFRGKVLARRAGQPSALAVVWQQVTLRNAGRAFRVNRQHPLIDALKHSDDVAKAVERALRLVEEGLPVESIIMDSREHPDQRSGAPFAGDGPELVADLRDCHVRLVALGQLPDAALDLLAAIEPFRFHPDIVESFREALQT